MLGCGPLLFGRVDLVQDGGQLYLMELELTEPLLHLEHDGAGERMAEVIVARCWPRDEHHPVREGGLVGYALATTDIEQDAERFRMTGLTTLGPFSMQRMRPDGHPLSWRLLVPEGVSWCRPWPFLIHWDVPDDQRLSWEKPGTHPNGVTGWVGIAIAVRDLEGVTDLYQRQLGLTLSRRDMVPSLAARRATFQVGSSQIDLLMPLSNGPVQRALEEVGEGPFEVCLASRDLDQTRAYLTQHTVNFEVDTADPAALLLSPEQAIGARLVLLAQQSL